MLPNQYEQAIPQIFQRMGFTESQSEMATQFLHASWNQATKQLIALLMLIIFLLIPDILQALTGTPENGAAWEHVMMAWVTRWLPLIGASAAVILIVWIQICRNRMIDSMLANGFPIHHVATMRRMASHLDVYLLTLPLRRLFHRRVRSK